jgi:hypothetical protein
MMTQYASRRRFLQQSACGFGSLALASMLQESLAAANPLSINPLAAKPGHLPTRAKRVIFLFMQGGPSQMDLFDYKPELEKRHGEPIPFDVRELQTEDGIENSKLMKPIGKLSQYGKSGMWFSEHLPNLASHADKICQLNAMWADNPAHPPAVMQMQTGYAIGTHPSLGSWVSYGLGTENENLPAFMTIAPIASGDGGGPHLYHSAYLPAVHQGTPISSGSNKPGKQAMEASEMIQYLERDGFPPLKQQRQLDLINTLNRNLLAQTEVDALMEGAIESFELAFRMQMEAPKVLDLKDESTATLAMYGIGEKETDEFGRRCLMARRLAESGVRFIQVTQGGWDHHAQIASKLPEVCRSVDRPIAGLLADLKQRGLLDDTLVVFTGEFGRSAYDQDLSQGAAAFESYGRGHNAVGFSAWLAGGGVKGDFIHGRTDEFGQKAIEGKTHVHDLHATILHLLGLDHEKLTYRHAGRDFRLTDVHGSIIQEIIA